MRENDAWIASPLVDTLAAMGVQRSSAASLSREEGRILLELAACAVRNHLCGEPPPEITRWCGEEVPARLCERRGVFVTLERGGALRGCLGSIEGRDGLWRDVRMLAVEAACRDPRFAPVRREELPMLAVSISVMTPPHPIAPTAVEVGRHGLIVRRGARSGLLLPQVATEHGWDRETFLDHTCLKAGLAAGTWREAGTELYAFEAQVFGPEPFERLV